jgi:preprotein translocase subunit SecF
MKPLRFVPDNTNIKFMKVARPGFIASIGAVLASIVLFFTVSLNYGIDFTGGTEILVRPTAENAQTLNIDEMRGIVGGLGLGSTELQEFGTDGDVAIRIGLQDGGEEAQQAAVAKVREAFGERSSTARSTRSVRKSPASWRAMACWRSCCRSWRS